MHKKYFFSLALIFFVQHILIAQKPTLSDKDKYNLNKDTSGSIKNILITWSSYKNSLFEYAKKGTQNDPSCYYNLQQYLTPVMEIAFKCNQNLLIDDLIQIVEISYSNLKSFSEVKEKSNLLGLSPLNKYSAIASDNVLDDSVSGASSETRTWFNEKNMGNGRINYDEIRLNNFQFLFFVCRLNHSIAATPGKNRTQRMNDFLKRSNNFITKDQLVRNIYKAKYSNWKDLPKVTGYTELKLKLHYKRIKKDGSIGPAYFNAVLDRELWLIASVAEWLAANRCDSSLIQLTKGDKILLTDYLLLGCELLKSRLSNTSLVDFQNNHKNGIVFDAGIWAEHPDYKYANYEGNDFPTNSTILRKVENIGWDVSHASRFPWVFNTLYKTKEITGSSFPSIDIMQGLSNQFAYGVFNKDFHKPLFKNYMDGTNGWFRVNYARRDKFGYKPFELSRSFLNGSRMQWAEYNHDIANIFQAVHLMLESKDENIIAFKNQFYIKNKNGVDSFSSTWDFQFECAYYAVMLLK